MGPTLLLFLVSAGRKSKSRVIFILIFSFANTSKSATGVENCTKSLLNEINQPKKLRTNVQLNANFGVIIL